MIRVIVVDDHPVTRLGLAALLAGDARIEVVGEAATVEEGLTLWARARPDVAVLDLLLSEGTALDLLAALRRDEPAARALIVTGAEGEEHAWRALNAGVNGYLPKSCSPETLVEAVCAIAAGSDALVEALRAQLAARASQPELTPRELDVLRLLVLGRSNGEIAVALSLGTGTVRTHVANILQKLNAGDRTEAVSLALRRGIV